MNSERGLSLVHVQMTVSDNNPCRYLVVILHCREINSIYKGNITVMALTHDAPSQRPESPMSGIVRWVYINKSWNESEKRDENDEASHLKPSVQKPINNGPCGRWVGAFVNAGTIKLRANGKISRRNVSGVKQARSFRHDHAHSPSITTNFPGLLSGNRKDLSPDDGPEAVFPSE